MIGKSERFFHLKVEATRPCLDSEHNPGFYLPSVDPIWNAVRGTARFRALMTRVHLPS